MRKSLIALALVLTMGASANAEPLPTASLVASTVVLTKAKPRLVAITSGTIVPVILDRKLSSQTDKTDDVFGFTAASDIVVDGMLVIAKGAIGGGHILSAGKAGAFGKTGSLVPSFDWVTGVDGNRIHMTGVSPSLGGDNSGTVVAGSVASTVAGAFIPLAGFASLGIGGKKAEIGTDRPIKIFVESTVHVTANQAAKVNDGYAH